MGKPYKSRVSLLPRCKICGNQFTATRRDARYDTPACRQVASRLHRKNARLRKLMGSDDVVAIIPPREYVVPNDLVDFYFDLSRRVLKHWSQFGISVRQALALRKRRRSK